MDKKEILEKAQCENDDEGLKNARIKGQKWGVAAFSVVFVIVVVLNTIKDRSNDIPFMFYMAYLAAESVPEFIFTKKKSICLMPFAAALPRCCFLLDI